VNYRSRVRAIRDKNACKDGGVRWVSCKSPRQFRSVASERVLSERHTGKAMHTGACGSTHDVDMQHSFIDPLKQQHIAPNRAHRKEHNILIHNTRERQRKVVRACVCRSVRRTSVCTVLSP